MTDLEIIQSTITTRTTRSTRLRVAARWMVTFIGFPLGGIAAKVVAGPVDSVFAAIVGGLITGGVLGAAQSWGMGRGGPPARQWIVATAVGLMVGLGAGATAVGFETNLAALVFQGAICGLAVGATQAAVLRRSFGSLAVAWPFALGAMWAAGWAITTSVGVRVEEQFTVFGAAGAVVVTGLTVVLPLVLNPSERGTS